MGYRFLNTGNTITMKTMEENESYIVIDGVRYDPVKQKFDGLGVGSCKGCVFNAGSECTLPNIVGLSLSCGGNHTFVSRGEVAAQQRLTGRSEKELDLDNPIGFANAKLNTLGPPSEPDKADKVTRVGAIAKRSYYSFPNGVEAEDICRYLSFNLGNVVKYVCRVQRMDGYKKIEDLEKARDYLDNEIERLKEEFRNEIQGLKDKIAKQKEGDD